MSAPDRRSLTSLSPAELLDLVTSNAPALIAAGVASVQIDGLSFTLASSVPRKPEALPEAAPTPRQHVDPLRDASTYPGGRVPGYTRDKDKT